MHLFDWAVRVPLIVHAPGRLASRRVGVPVSLVDLLPTLVELGRPAARPSALELQGDGQSLLPLLDGRLGEERCVLAEYLAEGALAPIFMIRRGAHKFIWSEPDPPLLFDLEQDSDELDNLAERPACAEQVQALEAEVRERWDPQALRQAIVASQRTRRVAWKALAQGRKTPWEWTPALHRDGYVGGDVDLNVLEHNRRYPLPE
jgi:choline-sulfatase